MSELRTLGASRRIAFVVALLGAVPMARPAVAKAQSTPLPAGPVHEIAVEDEADPWSRRDGTGYANDIVRAAFRAAGVRVRLVPMPYSRCKQMVRTGAMPACFSMSADSSSREAAVFAATPIFTFSSDFYARVARPGGSATRA